MIKRNSNHGFTLIEMLIVVALIAILVAISIPLVGKALQRSQVATDMANERGCKAAITTRLASKTSAFEGLAGSGNIAYYDATAGKLVRDTTPAAYGKCKAHEGCYLKVTENTAGEKYTVVWLTGSTEKGVHKAEGETSDLITAGLVIEPGN